MGSLDIYWGCMFSGKSTTLLKLAEEHLATTNKSIVIINSIKDERGGDLISNVSMLSTHSFITREFDSERRDRILEMKTHNLSKIIRKDAEFIQIMEGESRKGENMRITPFNNDNYDLVLVDECQFYPDLVEGIKSLVEMGKHVICFGLISDFKMNKFGNLSDLFCYADHVHQNYAICKSCISLGKKKEHCRATFTALKSKPSEDKQVIVGSGEKYEATCREHHYIP